MKTERRHIPDGNIRTMAKAGFEEALTYALRPHKDYDADRWLFVPDSYTEYRYILGIKGKLPLICIGINPSTAAPDSLDPTLQSVQRIALANGYDSFMMLNISAQRATKPADLCTNLISGLHSENLKAMEYVLSLSEYPAVWAAWGTLIEKRTYLWECLNDMVIAAEKRNAVWLCAGNCSKAGHPHHPLYLRKDEKLKPFDIIEYMKAKRM